MDNGSERNAFQIHEPDQGLQRFCQMKVRAKGVTKCYLTVCSVRQGYALSDTLFYYIFYYIYITQEFRLESTSTYQTSPMPTTSSSSHREMQGLLETVNCHAAAVGKRNYSPTAKMILTLIPVEHRQTVLFDGEPLEDVDKFRCIGFLLVTTRQGPEEIRRRIYPVRSA